MDTAIDQLREKEEPLRYVIAHVVANGNIVSADSAIRVGEEFDLIISIGIRNDVLHDLDDCSVDHRTRHAKRGVTLLQVLESRVNPDRHPDDAPRRAHYYCTVSALHVVASVKKIVRILAVDD